MQENHTGPETNLPEAVDICGIEYAVNVYEPDPDSPCSLTRNSNPWRFDKHGLPPKHDPDTVTGGGFYLPTTIKPADRRTVLDQMIAEAAAHFEECGLTPAA